MEKADKNIDQIEIFGARTHNLDNIDLSIPRNKLVVITGLSGSGKSSLAFDTLYAEGQRRYIETFSAYARQFLGNLERPDVDKITGLSPVIAIEQKTTNKNPRSTVGTITEIYDFLRLFYARVSTAYSHITNEKMIKYSDDQIIDLILENYENKKAILLSPIVKGRKGHYKELFYGVLKKGFLNVRIDGEIKEISFGMKIDRYKTHDIEIIVDKFVVSSSIRDRLKRSIEIALKHGKGIIMILDPDTNEIKYFSRNLMCPTSGIAYQDPEPYSFSFNSSKGACPRCSGLGRVSEIDTKKIIPNNKLSIFNGGIIPIGNYKNALIFWQLEAIGKKFNFTLNTPICKISDEALDVIFNGYSKSLYLENTPLGKSSYKMSFDGIINHVESMNASNSSRSKKIVASFIEEKICPECGGARLKKESLYFLVNNKNIFDLSKMDLQELNIWFSNLELNFTERQMIIAKDIIKEIRSRLQFLTNVGLGYLSVNRPSATLSGGESQRIRLASQIGSNLVNVLYIFDEPSIGLHQRDNTKLIESLKKLRDVGNSIIVVEHDKEMIMSADYVIDIGPGAGRNGGKIVSVGTPKEIETAETLTAQYLTNKKKIEIPKKRRIGNGEYLILKKAKGNNLQSVNIKIPLGTLCCITGVSGSGKSTLINKTLAPLLYNNINRVSRPVLEYQSVEGVEFIDKVIEVNQSPIGKTPRSNPATYTDIFTEIRKLFVQLAESKIRGYKLGRFSFNVVGGRCETCKGSGLKTIEMNFLPNVYVECDDCNGKRYNRETLEVRYRGKSIYDVLEMTVNQAYDFFDNIPTIHSKIKTLKTVGLGYVKLGQQSTTLSGGESQRVKLSAELSKKDTGRTLYILDEPTTGLHFEDIKILLGVLNKLVDKGNTVLVIEHNMDVIKVSDYIIDIGPEGGNKGGKVMCSGTPEMIVKKNTHTAKYLSLEL